MVIHPLSPPVYPNDYPQTFPAPIHIIHSEQTSLKRKRQVDKNERIGDTEDLEHISKRLKEHNLPQIPLSPPTSISSLQSTPPSESDRHIAVPFHRREAPTSAPSYISQEHSTGDISIPAQNLLLRGLHMNSRVYQQNQKRLTPKEDADEETWDAEEEVVAERYAEMNKILGSRRMNW